MESTQASASSGNNRILIAAGTLAIVVLAIVSMKSQDKPASTPTNHAPAPIMHHDAPASVDSVATFVSPAQVEPKASEQASSAPAPLDAAALKALMNQGEELYHACVVCHGPSGEGIPGQYPPLKGSPIVTGPESRFARVLLHGLEGVVVVDGKVYNMPMPAAPLNDDDEVAAAMTFVRRSFGNNASAVRPETVARIREETKSREKSWTASELNEVP